MKWIQAAGILAIVSTMRVQADPTITAFGLNGVLVGSNLTAGTTAAVEWASTPGGPWTNSWKALAAIPVGPSGVITAAVPFFYRVRDAVPPEMIPVTTTTSTTTSSTTTTAPPAVPLAPDDVAVVRVDAAGETVTVVALRALSANDTLYWTDNGWMSNNTFRTGEGGGAVDIITNTWAAGQTFGFGTSSLNASGEQLFLFTGTLATPTLIYGIQWGTAAGWVADATTPGTSADPAVTGGGLADEHTVALGTGAAWVYGGPTSGTVPALLGSVADAANWSTNSAAVWSGGTFTIIP